MVVANTQVDLAALKSRHPLGDVVEACGRAAEGKGPRPSGRLPLPPGVGRQLYGVRRHVQVLLLRLWSWWGRAGLYPAGRGPHPARGDTEAGRWDWAGSQPCPVEPRQVAPRRYQRSPWFPSGIRRRCRRQRGSTSGPCSRAPRRVSIWAPGASASTPPAAWVLATHRGTGCASTLKPPDSAASGYGPRACSPSGASGSQGWWWFPTWPRDASAGLWAGPLTRSGRRGFRRCPDPSRCLDLGGLGLRRLGWSLLKGCSTGLP